MNKDQPQEMAKSTPHHFSAPALTPSLFEAFGRFVTTELGIKMPTSKLTMLQSRLQKRLRQLNLPSFEAYYDLIFSDQGRRQELHFFLDTVTTNKTDFFREPRHYQVLADRVLPDLILKRGIGAVRPMQIWSAGCSTGAEPYTLAMIFENLREHREGFKYRILATDVSTRVLQKAQTAIYDERDAAPIPMPFKKKYLLRSKDRNSARIRIVPALRQRVEFKRLNFMDQDYAMANAMDIILCRNVIIYFDRSVQFQVLSRLCRCLKPNGFLFMGHSETLNGFTLPLRQITANVYCRLG